MAERKTRIPLTTTQINSRMVHAKQEMDKAISAFISKASLDTDKKRKMCKMWEEDYAYIQNEVTNGPLCLTEMWLGKLASHVYDVKGEIKKIIDAS